MLDLIHALVFIQLTAEECLSSSKRKPQDCRESKWLFSQRQTSDKDEANWKLLLIVPRKCLTLKHCSWATEILWWVFIRHHGTHHAPGILSSLLDTNKWVRSKLQAFTFPLTNSVCTNTAYQHHMMDDSKIPGNILTANSTMISTSFNQRCGARRKQENKGHWQHGVWPCFLMGGTLVGKENRKILAA